jgi:hypothetical protein
MECEEALVTAETSGDPDWASPPIPVLRLGPAFDFLETAFDVVAPHALERLSDRPASGRYVIVIAVCDYIRLKEGARERQVLYALGPEHEADIREGRALLLLDLSNEGPPFDAEIFEALHEQLDARAIPRDRVVFICQNRRLADDYAWACGAGGIGFRTLDYFPLTIVSLFDRRRQNVDLGDYAPFNGRADRIFNCLNSAPRWHRVIVFRWLQENGLLPDGVVSFHGASPDNPKGNEIDLAQPPPEVAAAFPHLVRELLERLPREPYRYDGSGDFGNALSTTLPVEVYARSSLSVVTESDFFGARTERVTEKSIKAAAMGLPFILVGPKGSVALIRSLGFRTFDCIIDHSYDDLDDIPRMEACLKAIERSVAAIRGDALAWRLSALDDALHNAAHARAGLATRFRETTVAPLLRRLEAFVAGAIHGPVGTA